VAKKFTEILETHVHEPYTWRVRHFEPNNAHEASFFHSRRKILRFCRKIPEKEQGTTITASQAQKLGESSAEKCGIDMKVYTLVAPSLQINPSGRVDHTFVYEHKEKQVGEGKYQLRIRVTGDKVTTIQPFVQIPEAFLLRYQEMRSYNTSLAWFAYMLMIFLYVFGGCLVGFITYKTQRPYMATTTILGNNSCWRHNTCSMEFFATFLDVLQHGSKYKPIFNFKYSYKHY
jgi:hypothetical protein